DLDLDERTLDRAVLRNQRIYGVCHADKNDGSANRVIGEGFYGVREQPLNLPVEDTIELVEDQDEHEVESKQRQHPSHVIRCGIVGQFICQCRHLVRERITGLEADTSLRSRDLNL